MVEPEELQEMVCEACMSKAPFLWTYAAHFAGNSFSWAASSNLCLTLQMLSSEYLGSHFIICHSTSVPPVVSVSHPEEDVEVDVEEGSDKEDDSEPSQTGDEEPSTSLEDTKQEVRNGAYETISSISHD